MQMVERQAFVENDTGSCNASVLDAERRREWTHPVGHQSDASPQFSENQRNLFSGEGSGGRLWDNQESLLAKGRREQMSRIDLLRLESHA
jgi:hypothetical protein